MTARLVILYGHLDDSEVFEDYYAHRHIPYATEHMPNVVGVRNARVVGTVDGARAPYYRISHLECEDLDRLWSGVESGDGRSTIADLDNFATGGATLLVVEDESQHDGESAIAASEGV